MSGEADSRKQHLSTLLVRSSLTNMEEPSASASIMSDTGDLAEGWAKDSFGDGAFRQSSEPGKAEFGRQERLLFSDGEEEVASSLNKMSIKQNFESSLRCTPLSNNRDLANPADPAQFNKPFPFCKLPGELRNRIYELLLIDQRDPSNRIIHGNDLQRRAEHRSRTRRRHLCSLRGYQPLARPHLFLNKPAGQRYQPLDRQHLFLNNTAATLSRLAQPNSKPALKTPLLETSILRVSRQTRQEGMHILYTLNNFAIMVVDPAFDPDFNVDLGTPARSRRFVDALPVGTDISSIRQLRIELQLSGPEDYNPIIGPTHSIHRYFRPCIWVPFCMMRDLKSLQIFVTFYGDRQNSQSSQSIRKANRSKSWFERSWRILPAYTNTMRDLVAAIPKHVETVTWGLSKEQKVNGDYGGLTYVKGCVLRKMYSTFEGLRGTAVGDMAISRRLDRPLINRMRIDGDGNDSDEDG